MFDSRLDEGRYPGDEVSHVMLSIMALALHLGVRHIRFSEPGRTAPFYVVMVFVTPGIVGLFGFVGRGAAISTRPATHRKASA